MKMASTPQPIVVRFPVAMGDESSASDPGRLLTLAEELNTLVREGMLVAFEDEHGVLRYHPVLK